MWLELIGSGMVLWASDSVGRQAAANLAGRPGELRALLAVLQMLETEIEYAATPLPQALRRVAEAVQGVARDALRRGAQALHSDPALPASRAWGETVRHLQEYSCLRADDLVPLQTLGAYLGGSDRLDQIKHLALAREQLKTRLERAQEDLDRLGRVYRYSGLCAGLTLVLVLI